MPEKFLPFDLAPERFATPPATRRPDDDININTGSVSRQQQGSMHTDMHVDSRPFSGRSSFPLAKYRGGGSNGAEYSVAGRDQRVSGDVRTSV